MHGGALELVLDFETHHGLDFENIKIVCILFAEVQLLIREELCRGLVAVGVEIGIQ